jgi:PD-(D/E)XK nuclease superfamily protein
MPSPRSTTAQGEWAEVCFAQRAVREGLVVSRPCFQTARYDFIVDSGRRLSRVQVKSVSKLCRGAYRVATSSGKHDKKGYTPDEIDFFAAYVVPHDAWYISPICEVPSIVALNVCPHRPSRRKYEKYREAWRLFFPGVRRHPEFKKPVILSEPAAGESKDPGVLSDFMLLSGNSHNNQGSGAISSAEALRCQPAMRDLGHPAYDVAHRRRIARRCL